MRLDAADLAGDDPFPAARPSGWVGVWVPFAELEVVAAPEAEFQRWVIAMAVQAGWRRDLIYHPHYSVKSTSGWPDLVLGRAAGGPGKPARLIVVELKTDENRGSVTTEQADWLRLLATCGVEAGVWSPADVATIMRVLWLGERVELPADIARPGDPLPARVKDAARAVRRARKALLTGPAGRDLR